MIECTVSELNNRIKDLFDTQANQEISLTGEISAAKRSGRNMYVTLKDSDATIETIFWGYPDFPNKEGDKVIIKGRLNYYAKSGRVNFIGKSIELMGVGELYKEYQMNFEKFKEAGYFDNKKDLPKHINSIGILTAKDGAALQDVLCTLKKNMFKGQVYVYNCVVQGAKCPASIVSGIKHFTKSDLDIDLLLITRGGGSFEDLVGFSDPKVVKAISKCKIYTLSAVGHEVDSMLSDFAANYRSPTPTDAGDVISRTHLEKLKFIEDTERYLETSIMSDRNSLNITIQRLYHYKGRVPNIEKEIDKELDYMNNIDAHYNTSIKNDLLELENRIYKYKNRLESNEHSKILDKGYVLLSTTKGKIVKTEKRLRKFSEKNLNMDLLGKRLLVNVKIIDPDSDTNSSDNG